MSSERTFKKLAHFKPIPSKQDDDENLETRQKLGPTQFNRSKYADMLAPYYDQSQDFSTQALQKNKGSNLTGEKLAKAQSPSEMICMIMAKAGIASFERINRVFCDALALV